MADGSFPRPVKLSPGTVRWRESDIRVWLDGLPTAKAPREFTKSNSLVGGPKPMVTLKVALLDLDEFQTVLPQVDSRDPVSFGRVLNRD